MFVFVTHCMSPWRLMLCELSELCDFSGSLLMVSGSWSRMPHLMSRGERSRVELDMPGDIIRLEMLPSSPGHSPATGFWSWLGPRLGLHVTAATVAE